jgi:HD-GYP domain-containing protein (c-di-GMP phosphodiesterase class II)
MPLLLRCDELEPGMRLAEAIVYKERVLLTGGKRLTHADVDALKRRFPALHARVGDPILDEMVEFEDDGKERKVAATVKKKMAGAMSHVAERFSSQTSLTTMDISALHRSVLDVMDYLEKNPVSAALIARNLDSDSYLAEHAGSVFYLSMLLGAALRDYVAKERVRTSASPWLDPKISMDLVPLGMGAMLADIGMYPLRHLFEAGRPLSQEDRSAVLQHPVSGADMLPDDLHPLVRLIVRTHHENFNGTGYPEGRAGEKIHVFSRIIRIVDAYDAATASHAYQEAKSSARALWEMHKGPYRRLYDPVLMKVFVRLIQPFPIGARLRLRDGRYAVVVRYNRRDPFHPTVLVAFDVNGARLPQERLEGPLTLGEDRRELRIESFGDEPLSFLYSSLPDSALEKEDVHLLSKREITLFESVYP